MAHGEALTRRARMVHLLSFAGAACSGVVWGWAMVLLGGPGHRKGWLWSLIILATVALPGGFAGLGLIPWRFIGTAIFVVGATTGLLTHIGWLSVIRIVSGGVVPGG
jgi:hypothetical protein